MVFIMKFSTLFTMAVMLASASAKFLKGFSFTPYNPDGSCKNSSDWQLAFSHLMSIPGGFTTARLTSTSECSALANAVPCAIVSNVSLLASVVAEPEYKYQAEKAALLSTLQQHEDNSFNWLMGVSVGLEDAALNVANMSRLVAQIWDVRGMIALVPGTNATLVGHVDNLSGWRNSTHMPMVISASDFLGLDFDPYFEDGDIDTANITFWAAVKTMWTIGQSKPVWVTQSAWPVTAPVNASGDLAKRYYDETLCPASTEVNVFMNHLRDFNSSLSYGVLNESWGAIYDTNCSFTDGASTGTTTSTRDTSTSAATTTASASEGSYTVKSSDNIWNIASSYGIPISQLESANPAVVPMSITVGQVLALPAPMGTTADPSGTNASPAPPSTSSTPSPGSSSPGSAPNTAETGTAHGKSARINRFPLQEADP